MISLLIPCTPVTTPQSTPTQRNVHSSRAAQSKSNGIPQPTCPSPRASLNFPTALSTVAATLLKKTKKKIKKHASVFILSHLSRSLAHLPLIPKQTVGGGGGARRWRRRRSRRRRRRWMTRSATPRPTRASAAAAAVAAVDSRTATARRTASSPTSSTRTR